MPLRPVMQAFRAEAGCRAVGAGLWAGAEPTHCHGLVSPQHPGPQAQKEFCAETVTVGLNTDRVQGQLAPGQPGFPFSLSPCAKTEAARDSVFISRSARLG